MSAVKNTKLGTTRILNIASYDKHTCSDTKLTQYNTIIGTTLLSIVGFISVVTLVLIISSMINNLQKDNSIVNITL